MRRTGPVPASSGSPEAPEQRLRGGRCPFLSIREAARPGSRDVEIRDHGDAHGFDVPPIHTFGERPAGLALDPNPRQKILLDALDRGLDEADARGWVVVSMKDDWGAMYPASGESTE